MSRSDLRRRDRAVSAVANFVLRFASKGYRDLIAGSVSYGMSAAARDSLVRAPLPEPWQVLANARSVTEDGCECQNRPNEYRGRDGWWHCFNCDGRVEPING